MNKLMLALAASIAFVPAAVAEEAPPLATSLDPAINTAVTPVPKLENDSYDWYQRHADVLALQKTLKPQIVMIGDSITHFWGGPPGNRANGPLAWKEAFGDLPVLNMGFGWDRTQNVLWRLDHGEFEGISPRVVVINIGTNNTSQTAHARANTPEEIAAGVLAIVERVRAKAPDARILVMAIFPRGEQPDTPLRKTIAAANAGIQRLLAGRPKVSFLDIGDKLLEPDGTLSRATMGDFTHPTEKGYSIWAKALVAAGVRE